MKICIKHLLFASILLISGNMAAQSLFVSSAMDEETISQAVLYSEGLYDLLPTYIETEEEKLKLENNELILKDITSNECQKETTKKIKKNKIF